MLDAYDRVVPGAAERIIRMAEQSAEARTSSLTAATSAEIRYRRSGQLFAYSLALLALVPAIVFFALGNNVAGGILLSVPVLLLVRSFLHQGGGAEE